MKHLLVLLDGKKLPHLKTSCSDEEMQQLIWDLKKLCQVNWTLSNWFLIFVWWRYHSGRVCCKGSWRMKISNSSSIWIIARNNSWADTYKQWDFTISNAVFIFFFSLLVREIYYPTMNYVLCIWPQYILYLHTNVQSQQSCLTV